MAPSALHLEAQSNCLLGFTKRKMMRWWWLVLLENEYGVLGFGLGGMRDKEFVITVKRQKK